jgi:hypothetical protein
MSTANDPLVAVTYQGTGELSLRIDYTLPKNSGPAVYETGVNHTENSEVSTKQDTERTATHVETPSDDSSRATKSATIGAAERLRAIVSAWCSYEASGHDADAWEELEDLLIDAAREAVR